MVVAIAVVGDLFADSVAATVLSRLMLVLGVAALGASSPTACLMALGVRGLVVYWVGHCYYC